MEMINAYRVRGHLMADTDPLEYRQRRHHDLDVQSHGLTLWDLDREFATGSFVRGEGRMKMRKILGILRDSYCRTTGIEYMHIQEPVQRKWIQDRVSGRTSHSPRGAPADSRQLNEAEIFETFLQTKFVGQKRFSLEGGESAIVLLDEVCEQAAEASLEEVCIGMPHRGRLNVLSNIVGKSYEQIFREFEGNLDPPHCPGLRRCQVPPGLGGQVHRAQRRHDQDVGGGEPEPSRGGQPGAGRHRSGQAGHPRSRSGVPGATGADARRRGVRRSRCRRRNPQPQPAARLPDRRHDSSSNNQVGFTTSPTELRSSMYCTDVARMIQAPIFHVNGDDPEACIRGSAGVRLPPGVQQGRGHRPIATAAAVTTRATTRASPNLGCMT